MWVSDTSIKQPVLVTMLMALALVLGLLAYAALPVDLLPDVSFPTVSVTVALPGAGPTEMADQVAKPIEDGMGTVQGVRHITSRSSEGVTTLVIEFNTDRKVDQAAQDVRDKMAQVKPQLPQEATPRTSDARKTTRSDRVMTWAEATTWIARSMCDLCDVARECPRRRRGDVTLATESYTTSRTRVAVQSRNHSGGARDDRSIAGLGRATARSTRGRLDVAVRFRCP